MNESSPNIRYYRYRFTTTSGISAYESERRDRWLFFCLSVLAIDRKLENPLREPTI